jgi:hypothetical protein
VIGVCEGRFFERLGDAMGDAQKVVLEQTPARLFYINDIIASLQKPKKTITTLCNEL